MVKGFPAIRLLVVADLLSAGAAAAAPRLPANAEPVRSFGELSDALTACWSPPPGTQGFEITLRFGLTGKGELRGKPLATHSVLPGPPDIQRAFVAAAIMALSDCTPVRMSEDFARIAASRVLNLRFRSGKENGRAGTNAAHWNGSLFINAELQP